MENIHVSYEYIYTHYKSYCNVVCFLYVYDIFFWCLDTKTL